MRLVSTLNRCILAAKSVIIAGVIIVVEMGAGVIVQTGGFVRTEVPIPV